MSASLVKPSFEFHIHSDYHVSNSKGNTTVFFLSQYPLFQTPKNVNLLLAPLPPLVAPASTDTTIVIIPACTFALPQPMVKFPWPRPRTGCAYYPCGLAIVVVKVCRADSDRYAVSGNANSTFFENPQ